MRHWLDSLYTRLALVLLLALLTGFATMALLFRAHIDQSRQSGIARGIANQIRLVEALRGQLSVTKLAEIDGIELAAAPKGAEDSRADPFLGLMRKDLSAVLGREVEVVASTWRTGGFWVKLSGPPAENQWLFLPRFFDGPLPPPPRGVAGFPIPLTEPQGGPPSLVEHSPEAQGAKSEREATLHDKPRPRFLPPGPPEQRWLAFWAGFAVVLVGGMALLWQVQAPLSRLVEAMRKVGSTRELVELKIRGPREVQSLVFQFNQMVARLRQSAEERNIMLAGIAHDLRSPLTRLRLQMELALEAHPRYPAMVRNLESIDAIIDQFLLFAQGGEHEMLENRDLALFIGEVAAEYEERGLVLDLDPALAQELPLRAGALRRAIHNLVDNAYEYGAAPVLLRCRREGSQILIQVIDHGHGIPDAERERALQPFSRLDDARSGPGHCGLGLAIVAQVAAAHGGQFSLHAVAPSGLMAQISLPLAAG